ncbi:MAG: mannose-1-phosphate guanylyltransferase [Bacteroidia bacterium]|nr:mannose-1-phosphate guanylyltransferase [Bacteroidia bacterium]
MNTNNFCIIMAGGIGSRFWPLSRTNKPKQFLDILNTGRTFLQSTFDRFKDICPVENIYIVTNKDYKDLVLEQLPELTQEQVLLEPQRKNTAPCIAYANYTILKRNPNANIVVAPSDHLIINTEEFKRTILKALDFTNKNDALLTIGIKPLRPETGYGYIQVNNEEKYDDGLLKVKTFTEKPNLQMAKVFCESGEFFWNSGIFIWSLKSIMSAFEEHLHEVDILFKEALHHFSTYKEDYAISSIYSECKNISIDYGVMEKAKNVFVISADFGWSDLGTWGSLYENLPKDENQNVIKGNDTVTYDTKNCIINTPENKLVVINGLSGYILVDTNDTLLICKKEDEQHIRQIVNDIKIQKGDTFI